MSKLTYEDRIEIYNRRKNGETISNLSRAYKIGVHNIEYLIRLIDAHGFDVLRKDKNNHYSKELKQKIMDEVLIDGNSAISASIKYGLPSNGTIYNWIKQYKENNYTIVEDGKGRPPTMKKENAQTKDYKNMTDKEKIEYLEYHNLCLEAENEYLKKLRAVVQQRKDRQLKKK